MSIKGRAVERIDFLGYEICLFDKHRNLAFTFEFKAHKIEDNSIQVETTKVTGPEGELLLKALSEALTELGFLHGSATDSELKATKYHLEDMRRAFSRMLEPRIKEQR